MSYTSKKILRTVLFGFFVLSLGNLSFAKEKCRKESLSSTKQSQRVFKIIEDAFNKPVFSTGPISVRNFDYKRVSQMPDLEKQIYLSYFLKAQRLGLVENSKGVTVMREVSLVKSASPVFKESLPENLREMYVTLILELPKNRKMSHVDKSLRSLYSRAGDLKVSPDGRKLIISDWSSNALRVKEVVSKL